MPYLCMGYVRQYNNTEVISDDVWNSVTEKFSSLISIIEREMGDTLHGKDGTSSPVINDSEIIFNGNRSNDNDFEPMIVEKNPTRGYRQFCKTNRKPYDLAVAVLIRILIDENAEGIVNWIDGPTEWDKKVDTVLAGA